MAGRQTMNVAKTVLQRLAIVERVGANQIAAEEFGSNFGFNKSSGSENNFSGKFGNNFNTGYGKTNMGRTNSGQNNSEFKSSFGANQKSGDSFGQGSNFGNF